MSSNKEEHALKIRNFILKLAGNKERSDRQAAISIADQLEQLQNDKSFPEVFDSIDPDSYHSETKLLGEKERRRLRQGLAEYSKRKEGYL